MSYPKIGVVSLGCPKNTTDTETMLGLLNEAGIDVTLDVEDAEICLVNTCSFITSARQESVRTLVELAAGGKKLIVAGCLAQHFKDELAAELPEAKAFVGTGDIASIVEIVKSISENAAEALVRVSNIPQGIAQDGAPRMRLGVGASAYVKIAEGCDHRCGFCIIPMLRGKYRSRSVESIVKEARELVDCGVREIILVSQDSSYYGVDLYGRPALDELLEALNEIEDLLWIRAMYFYPGEVSDKLLKVMARLPKVVKYIDIPLQHSHRDILSAMARPIGPERIVARIRELVPGVAIRSTFITGLPGETDEHFEHLARFVEESCFDRLGVFEYSREMESAAGQMDQQVPLRIAKNRRRRLMEIQRAISTRRNNALVGCEIDVLVESFDQSKKLYVGRSQWDAPEIDNLVYVRPTGGSGIIIGDLVRACVRRAKPYDLFADGL